MCFVMEGFLGGQKRQRAQFGVALSRQAPLCLSSLGQEALQLSFFFHFFLSLPPGCPTWGSFPTLLPPLNSSTRHIHKGKQYSLWCCTIVNLKKWGFMKSYYNMDLKLLGNVLEDRDTTFLFCPYKHLFVVFSRLYREPLPDRHWWMCQHTLQKWCQMHGWA